MPPKGEVAKLNDPNFIIEIAAGPPLPSLVAQEPGTGLQVGRKHDKNPRRFILKGAHMSKDDYRIYDDKGHLMCNSFHAGKNPYGALDPLGVGHGGPKQEWESLCNARGYRGMPNFKVKPKLVSKHGRQFIMSPDNRITYLSVANESRIKTMSVRHNMEACEGQDGPKVWSVLADMAGRTLQVVNEKEEQVAFIQKSMKALVMTAALGNGSELVIDVAPGVDWTAVLALVIGIQQIGESFAKDVVGNFVAPKVQDAALEAAGLDGVANQLGKHTDALTHQVRQAQNLINFFKQA